jgi:RpiR family carbohydrate utilization transcriptional regulator
MADGCGEPPPAAVPALASPYTQARADGGHIGTGRLLDTDAAREGIAGNAPTNGGALPYIRSLLPSLNAADQRVARAILDDPQAVVELSSNQLGARAATSGSTVVRCCQRMGFRGYQQLRMLLARETQADTATALHHGSIRETDASSVLVGKVFGSAARALMDATRTLDPGAFDRAVTAISTARRVVFVGVGTSASLAQDAAYRFLTIGIVTDAPPDIHVQHVTARLTDSLDVVLALSHTGATRDTLNTVLAAREAGATTIAVTSFERSPLTKIADIVLVAGGPELSFRREAMASRLVHLSVLDALYIAVALRHGTRAVEALDATAEVLASHRLSVRRQGAPGRVLQRGSGNGTSDTPHAD